MKIISAFNAWFYPSRRNTLQSEHTYRVNDTIQSHTDSETDSVTGRCPDMEGGREQKSTICRFLWEKKDQIKHTHTYPPTHTLTHTHIPISSPTCTLSLKLVRNLLNNKQATGRKTCCREISITTSWETAETRCSQPRPRLCWRAEASTLVSVNPKNQSTSLIVKKKLIVLF